MTTKQEILDLLSDNEVARVSRAEDECTIDQGGEYVDLDHLDRGVQKAGKTTHAHMRTVLPRSTVSPETWSRIAAALAA